MSDEDSRADLRATFEAEALPHLSRLHATARRLARSAADAEDLVQETFLRAYRTFANYRPGTNCRAWLLTILHSVHVNRLRRRRHEPESEPDEELERRAVAAIVEQDWEATLLAAATERGLGVAVEDALRRLPESFRQVVVLVEVDGFTYEEAAHVLDAPIGTIRSRLSRARRLLAAELAGYAFELGIPRRRNG